MSRNEVGTHAAQTRLPAGAAFELARGAMQRPQLSDPPISTPDCISALVVAGDLAQAWLPRQIVPHRGSAGLGEMWADLDYHGLGADLDSRQTWTQGRLGLGADLDSGQTGIGQTWARANAGPAMSVERLGR